MDGKQEDGESVGIKMDEPEFPRKKWSKPRFDGLCARCGLVPKYKTYSYCLPCLKEYSKELRRRHAKFEGDDYYEILDKGLCVDCKVKPRLNGTSYYGCRCYECGRKKTIENRQAREKRRGKP